MSCHNIQQIDTEPNQDNHNERMLFDGQTLDGWEITDFGLQGPVNIEEGSIILDESRTILRELRERIK